MDLASTYVERGEGAVQREGKVCVHVTAGGRAHTLGLVSDPRVLEAPELLLTQDKKQPETVQENGLPRLRWPRDQL